MSVRYYVRRDLRSDEPIAVYRRFDDPQRAPEILHAGSADWRVSEGFWAELASGGIDESDRVDEARVSEIVAAWKAS
jgi:hypothetical protein